MGEYNSVLNVLSMPIYADSPPSQVVPALADKGIYLASESTMYRILRAEKMQKHRGYAKPPERKNYPQTYVAKAPNEVWTWDITWLHTMVAGMYFKLYVIVDIFSRKIVGWEVWPEETGELAAILVEKSIMNEKTRGNPLVLHSDNGAPMKSFTLKAKLESLGVISSFSRPRVSNDNPYSESLFRTFKYRPGYPHGGFVDIDKARALLNIGKLTEKECKQCWAFRFCSACAVQADNLEELSAEKKLQNCALIRGHIDNMMRDYCVMRDLGCNFDKEKLFV